MGTENKNDWMEQFQNFTRSMDETIRKRFGNGVFQSFDNFLQNVSFSSDMPLEWEDNETEYILKAKIAGVPKDQISIDLIGNQIKISYTLETESTKKTASKSFTFHHPIDEDKITAHHQDGLLTLKIPKSKKKTIFIN